MERSISVELDLPPALLLALGRAARGAGLRPSDYVAAVLAAAIDRAGLRPLGAADIVRQATMAAADWLDLQGRLRRAGFVLRRNGAGDLMLHDWPLNRPVLPLADLGLSFAALTLQFRAPFPGESFAGPAPPTARRHAA
ncbi:MAG TPA: hypothetical protein PLI43_01445 [Albidovulum sp.]|uniref:hypothetical protein n=1 Tax=Albidovulum sp. TaxID=1872424 RepID=UPI002CAD2A3D|nr:hypothetical protein [Albidovulum sp.]